MPSEQSYYGECGGLGFAVRISDVPDDRQFPEMLHWKYCPDDLCPAGGEHDLRAVSPAELAELMADDDEE